MMRAFQVNDESDLNGLLPGSKSDSDEKVQIEGKSSSSPICLPSSLPPIPCPFSFIYTLKSLDGLASFTTDGRHQHGYFRLWVRVTRRHVPVRLIDLCSYPFASWVDKADAIVTVLLGDEGKYQAIKGWVWERDTGKLPENKSREP